MGSFPNSTIYQLSAANMFCGAAVDTTGLYLQLVEVKLPGWAEHYADWRPGGSPVAVEIPLHMQKLECNFSLVGWSPQVAELINAWSTAQNEFAIYGLIRDKFGGAGDVGGGIQVIANITGRLGIAEPERFSRGDLQHWTYSIRSIFAYTLQVGSELVYDWDFQQNSLSIGSTA